MHPSLHILNSSTDAHKPHHVATRRNMLNSHTNGDRWWSTSTPIAMRVTHPCAGLGLCLTLRCTSYSPGDSRCIDVLGVYPHLKYERELFTRVSIFLEVKSDKILRWSRLVSQLATFCVYSKSKSKPPPIVPIYLPDIFLNTTQLA